MRGNESYFENFLIKVRFTLASVSTNYSGSAGVLIIFPLFIYSGHINVHGGMTNMKNKIRRRKALRKNRRKISIIFHLISSNKAFTHPLQSEIT